MKRLYYLTKDLDVTERVAEALHASGIGDWHFHVLSQDQQGLFQHRVHSASALQRLDIIHLAERGALMGALFGTALGGTLWFFNPPGFPMDAGMFALILAVATLFGTWIGAMAGLSHQHYKIARFMPEIEAGHHLLMVDVRRSQQQQVCELMQERFPEARAVGSDSTWVNPLVPTTPYQTMR